MPPLTPSHAWMDSLAATWVIDRFSAGRHQAILRRPTFLDLAFPDRLPASAPPAMQLPHLTPHRVFWFSALACPLAFSSFYTAAHEWALLAAWVSVGFILALITHPEWYRLALLDETDRGGVAWVAVLMLPFFIVLPLTPAALFTLPLLWVAEWDRERWRYAMQRWAAGQAVLRDRMATLGVAMTTADRRRVRIDDLAE